ncbi:hypothetical protein [Hydrogenophaga sp. Root209]|nr:hypothetical protein [Hydrogenophaga sp. Root209]
MIESSLFAFDLVLVSYCCWIAFRAGKKPEVKVSDLGFFAFKETKKDIDK